MKKKFKIIVDDNHDQQPAVERVVLYLNGNRAGPYYLVEEDQIVWTSGDNKYEITIKRLVT